MKGKLAALALMLIVVVASTGGGWWTSKSKGTRHAFAHSTNGDTTALGNQLIVGSGATALFPSGQRFLKLQSTSGAIAVVNNDSIRLIYRSAGGSRKDSTFLWPSGSPLEIFCDLGIDTLEVLDFGWKLSTYHNIMEVVN